MALLAEYALTPDVFDATSYSSAEVCGLHLQALKEVLLHEGLVRDLRDGAWIKLFGQTARPWHPRGRELLKKLGTQRRLVPAHAALPQPPANDADWCDEALASHRLLPVAGVVVTDAIAALHASTPIVSSVAKLTSAAWWTARSPSVRLRRNFADYHVALDLVLRNANSLMFIDPHIDPSDVHQYSDLMRLLQTLQPRSIKPLVEIHRVAWYGKGNNKIPDVPAVLAAFQPLGAVAKATGIAFDVFLWADFHDRYLISDLIGVSLPHGFSTTRSLTAFTTWSRLGRAERDLTQRDFDPAHSPPVHRFQVK